ncbi:uncharacterized protein SCHCODRAFT_02492396 [Schizophyllum commune H4-8]|nr:uncharacterized protein SCHCODRAFT_02492396 [Schizophyllum commune H4-8]KAI5897245.1 hypothetical protein SCHCODRAFT_02492396 [Schizophyllum commune H4-8]
MEIQRDGADSAFFARFAPSRVFLTPVTGHTPPRASFASRLWARERSSRSSRRAVHAESQDSVTRRQAPGGPVSSRPTSRTRSSHPASGNGGRLNARALRIFPNLPTLLGRVPAARRRGHVHLMADFGLEDAAEVFIPATFSLPSTPPHDYHDPLLSSFAFKINLHICESLFLPRTINRHQTHSPRLVALSPRSTSQLGSEDASSAPYKTNRAGCGRSLRTDLALPVVRYQVFIFARPHEVIGDDDAVSCRASRRHRAGDLTNVLRPFSATTLDDDAQHFKSSARSATLTPTPLYPAPLVAHLRLDRAPRPLLPQERLIPGPRPTPVTPLSTTAASRRLHASFAAGLRGEAVSPITTICRHPLAMDIRVRHACAAAAVVPAELCTIKPSQFYKHKLDEGMLLTRSSLTRTSNTLPYPSPLTLPLHRYSFFLAPSPTPSVSLLPSLASSQSGGGTTFSSPRHPSEDGLAPTRLQKSR